MYRPPNQVGWEKTQAAIRGMNERARAGGRAFLLVLWPLLVDLEGHYPFEETHTEIARACGDARVPFLDLLPTFRGLPSAGLRVHPLDLHPSEHAHRLAAE